MDNCDSHGRSCGTVKISKLSCAGSPAVAALDGLFALLCGFFYWEQVTSCSLILDFCVQFI